MSEPLTDEEERQLRAMVRAHGPTFVTDSEVMGLLATVDALRARLEEAERTRSFAVDMAEARRLDVEAANDRIAELEAERDAARRDMHTAQDMIEKVRAEYSDELIGVAGERSRALDALGKIIEGVESVTGIKGALDAGYMVDRLRAHVDDLKAERDAAVRARAEVEAKLEGVRAAAGVARSALLSVRPLTVHLDTLEIVDRALGHLDASDALDTHPSDALRARDEALVRRTLAMQRRFRADYTDGSYGDEEVLSAVMDERCDPDVPDPDGREAARVLGGGR